MILKFVTENGTKVYGGKAIQDFCSVN